MKNWDKIPDTFKRRINEGRYGDGSGALLPDLSLEEHIVVLLLDRQKPSVIADYSFDEERIAVTRKGKVIWGFDSGCSCPCPWVDNYPNCYNVEKTWKEFVVNLSSFDQGVIEECMEQVMAIKQAVANLSTTQA